MRKMEQERHLKIIAPDTKNQNEFNEKRMQKTTTSLGLHYLCSI